MVNTNQTVFSVRYIVRIILLSDSKFYLRLAAADAAGSDAPRLVESREYLGDAAVGHE